MSVPTGKKAKEILNRVNSYISEGIAHCDAKHTRIEQNNIYSTTEQWSKGDILKQTLKDRPAVPWNSIFKIVEAIASREIVERFIPKVFGRSDADSGIANVLDEACKWQRQNSMSEHLESATVRSTVVGGYGWIHKYWDQSKNNGDGMIVDEDVPAWEMLWPARARMMNLSDRRWHVRGKWIGIDEAKARWSHLSRKAASMFKQIDNTVAVAATNSFPDTTTEIRNTASASVFGWGSLQNGSWINTAEREVFVLEAEWLEPQTVFKAAIPARFNEWEQFVNTRTQIQIDEENVLSYQEYAALPLEHQVQIQNMILLETVVVTEDSMDAINEFADRYEFATKREFEDYDSYTADKVKYALVVNNMVIDYGDRPWGFSYFCITGFPVETRNGMDFVGAVDIVKGPQDYKNALLSNALAMYMSSPKAPLFVEMGAVPNMEELSNRMSSPSALIPVPDGFLASKKFEWGDAPSFPPMLGPLLEFAAKGVEEAFGLSSIDLGTQQDLRRVSGNVVQAARAANNVIVARIFDAIRLFRKQYGSCNMKFITELYTIEDIIRIVGEEKIEDVGSVDISQGWGDVFKYDVLVDEQPSSPSELMELTDFLTRTGTLDNWRNRGDITMEGVLKLLPQIPESDKRMILEGNSTQEKLVAAEQQNQFLSNLIMQVSQDPNAAQIIQQAMQQQQIQQGLQGPSGKPPEEG